MIQPPFSWSQSVFGCLPLSLRRLLDDMFLPPQLWSRLQIQSISCCPCTLLWTLERAGSGAKMTMTTSDWPGEAGVAFPPAKCLFHIQHPFPPRLFLSSEARQSHPSSGVLGRWRHGGQVGHQDSCSMQLLFLPVKEGNLGSQLVLSLEIWGVFFYWYIPESPKQWSENLGNQVTLFLPAQARGLLFYLFKNFF